MAETWGGDFDLKTYIDHASQMSQAAVALQRRRPDDLPVDERIDREIEDIRRSGLFDAERYRAMYPDIQPPPKDPLHHYCARGWREGRNPSDDLDMAAYLAVYRDVAEADVNPLWHYVVRGRSEGRLAAPEIESRYEDDASASRLPDDVRLVASYAVPDWPAVRRAHAAAHGEEPLPMPHRDVGTYDPTDPHSLAARATLCRRHGIAAWCFHVDAAGALSPAHPLFSFLNHREIHIEFMLDVDLRGSRIHDSIAALAARAFADDRCLLVDGRPAVMVSLPTDDDACRAALADVARLTGSARTPYRLCRRDERQTRTPDAETSHHFDALVDFPLAPFPWETGGVVPRERNGFTILPYSLIVSQAMARMERGDGTAIPCHRAVITGRNESPLREHRPLCYTRPSLKDYRRWLDTAIADARATQPTGAQLVFLDAWNDWNRGAVLEPDRRTGYARLNETTRALLGIPVGTPLPKVSVIVMPTHDTAFLRQRLESVYGQTYGNLEVLLFDCDSAREGRDVFAEYAGRFPEITRRLLMTARPGERFRQWAEGIKAATGDLVWIAGGDGFCDDDLLERLVRCFDDEAVLLACARTEAAGPDHPRDRVASGATGDGGRHSHVTTAHREVAGGLETVMAIEDAGAVVFRRPVDMPLLTDERWLSSRITGDWLFYLHVTRGGRLAYSAETCAYVHGRSGSVSGADASPEVVIRELTAAMQVVQSLYDVPASAVEAIWQSAWERSMLPAGSDGSACVNATPHHHAGDAGLLRSPSIAIGLTDFYPGGAEFFPIRLANELKRQGHSVLVLSAAALRREAGVRRLLRSDIPVIETGDVECTKRLLEEFGIEVLNSHTWTIQNYPSIVPGVFGGLRAHVASLHGMLEQGNESTVTPSSLRVADENVSTWVYTTEKNLGPFNAIELPGPASERFVKLPNGIEPPVIDPIHRADLGIPDHAFVLCCVSRAIPAKGWAETIEAVARARSQAGRDIRLILVGNGPLYEDYRRDETPEFVSLIGFDSNSAGFYAAADMGIMLTTFKSESFPLTILDALFASRPYIATDVGEIRNMLSTDRGMAGEVIELMDWKVPIDRATEAIIRYATNPNALKAARERAVEVARKFHIDRVAAAYAAIFERDTRMSSPPRTVSARGTR
jgi:glycosyltransferase involved in cell wall biosynthesis